MKSIDRLWQYLANRPAQIRELKDKGAKVVGFFPGDYVPEEIIHASGAVPICLTHGGDPMAVLAAQSTTMRFQCAFSKAQLGEWLLKQQPYYKLVDILVAPITCAHLRKTADLWQYYTGIEVFRLGVPKEYASELGLEYYVGSIRRLKQRIETLTGNKVDDKELSKSIRLYNQMRQSLKEISLMRKSSQPRISTADFLRLNHASFYADPSFMTDMLASIREEIGGRQEEAVDRETPRLLLTGPNIACGDYKVLELVEEAGGTIVAEEVCEGVRYYWENVHSNDDLLTALADRYLKRRAPCAFMNASAEKRFDFIMNLVREFRVDGVLWYQLLYCETYDIESYYFSKRMGELGVPMLKLQSDYQPTELETLRTRIQAFIEVIRRRGRQS